MKTIISGLSILISVLPSILLAWSSAVNQESRYLGKIPGLPLMAFDPDKWNPIWKEESVRRIFWEEPVKRYQFWNNALTSVKFLFRLDTLKRATRAPCCGTCETEHLKRYQNLDEYPCPLYMGFFPSPHPTPGHVYVLLVQKSSNNFKSTVHLPVMEKPSCKAPIVDCVETFYRNSH